MVKSKKTRKKTLNFTQYCNLVKKLVKGEVDEEELHDMYVSWKKFIRVYNQTATESIIQTFEERILEKHGTQLKRTIIKKPYGPIITI